MTNKITGSFSKNEEINCKRFYLPGIKVKSECPNCNAEEVWDGNDWYLSYPTPGKPDTVHFYCEDCDEEWYLDVVLDINLKLVK